MTSTSLHLVLISVLVNTRLVARSCRRAVLPHLAEKGGRLKTSSSTPNTPTILTYHRQPHLQRPQSNYCSHPYLPYTSAPKATIAHDRIPSQWNSLAGIQSYVQPDYYPTSVPRPCPRQQHLSKLSSDHPSSDYQPELGPVPLPRIQLLPIERHTNESPLV